MKLVTFTAGPDPASQNGNGRVGRIADDTVVELDTASAREFFERGGQVPETGGRYPLAEVRLRAPIVPRKFFHTAGNFRERHEDLERVNWSHPDPAPGDKVGRVLLLQGDRHLLPDRPYIVTADEVGDPHDLDMELRVNGEVLKPGDVVEAEIEKLGILRNPVISWRDAYGTEAPPADSCCGGSMQQTCRR